MSRRTRSWLVVIGLGLLTVAAVDLIGYVLAAAVFRMRADETPWWMPGTIALGPFVGTVLRE